MKRNIGFLLITCCFILTVQIPGVCASNPSPEQLIAEHLKSIGDPAVISQIKSMVFTGNATVNFLLGATGVPNQQGTFTVASQGPQFGILMRFPETHTYPGEHFAYDGKVVTVANYAIGYKSPIAEFIHRYNKIMKNGILGGVISNAWPLLDIKDKKATMKVRKTKLGGTDVYELEYRPKDYHGDMKIRMYFDPETYRHLCTEYKVQTKDDITLLGAYVRPGDISVAATTSETYYTLVESFGGFKKIGDLTVPHSYTLEFSISHIGASVSGGFAAIWTMETLELMSNTDIDQRFFNTEK